jgi:hypothetical protein
MNLYQSDPMVGPFKVFSPCSQSDHRFHL